MAHRYADAAPVERVGGGGTEQHAINAHAGGVAEDGADVLVVPYSLKNYQGAGICHDVFDAQRFGFIRGD